MDATRDLDRTTQPTAVVAGHICIDIVPALLAPDTIDQLQPGGLAEVGPATVALGGCVANAGGTLARLGVPTRLVGKVGDDTFGRLVRDELERTQVNLAQGLLIHPGDHTSYSLVLSPPGRDRMFLHFPGANDTFSSDDIPDQMLVGRLFHFGYPPVMHRMYMGGGEDLACLLRRAKRAGLTTALDMAYPDPAREAGHVDWLHLLELVLPLVDIFVPSLDETSIMLRAPLPRDATDPAGAPLMAAHVHMLAERLLDLGAGMVGIKAGDRGFYLRTGTRERLRVGGPGMPADAAGWALRELWSPVFQVDVVSTVGSGDATVAGFLFGVLGGMGPEEAATAACAVGACSVEAADATSGVRTWDETSARLAHGWPRHHLCLGSRWRELPSLGLWAGPSDCGSGAA